MITSSVKINIAFNTVDNKVSKAVLNSMEDITDDLLRVASERAPKDTGTLEQSGTKQNPKISGGNCVSQVSFRAKRKGFNYATKMDKTKYKLGDKSLQKSKRGVRSAFSNESFSVGTGYLSDTAKKCSDEYTKYVQESVSKELSKLLK